MLYLPNTLPPFAKKLIGFHDMYQRMWKNIYPWYEVQQNWVQENSLKKKKIIGKKYLNILKSKKLLQYEIL